MSLICAELKDTVTVRDPFFSGVNTSLWVTFFSSGKTSLWEERGRKKKVKTITVHITAAVRIMYCDAEELSSYCSDAVYLPEFDHSMNGWSFDAERAVG
jgi:hypothetical protein